MAAPSFLKGPRLNAPGTTPSMSYQRREGTTHHHGPPAPTSPAGPLGGPTRTTPGGNSTTNQENEDEEEIDEEAPTRDTQDETDETIREAQETVRRHIQAEKDYEDAQTAAHAGADAGSPRTKVTTASQRSAQERLRAAQIDNVTDHYFSLPEAAQILDRRLF